MKPKFYKQEIWMSLQIFFPMKMIVKKIPFHV